MHLSSNQAGLRRLLSLVAVLLGVIPVVSLGHAQPAGPAASTANATLTLRKITEPAGGQDFPITAVGYTRSIDTSLRSPRDLDRDSSGKIYVIARQANRIDIYDPEGNYIESWADKGDGDGELWHPDDLAVYDNGKVTVYVADTENNRIQKFDANGAFLAVWGGPGKGEGQFDWPQGLAVDADGNIYVADTNNHRIQKFDPGGGLLAVWGKEGVGPGEYSYPSGIDIASNGDIYIADSNNHRIQVLDKTGKFLREWGTHGGLPGQLNLPSDLTLDDEGFVIVADTYNHRIQKFTMAGRYLAQWGDEGTGPAEFERPNGIMVAPGGETFVLDIDSDQIRIFHQKTVYLDDGGEESVDLPASNYRITEAPVTNWVLQAADCDGGGPGPVDGGIDVALDEGTPVTCTFTNAGSGLQVGAISAFVYHDRDQSGGHNSGDAPLGNWTVWLLDEQGQMVGEQQKTGDDGRFAFGNLASGDYQLCALLPAGWFNTQPGDGGLIKGAGQGICVQAAAVVGANTRVPFGQLQAATLVVRKQTNPDGAPGAFAFTSPVSELNGELSDGELAEVQVVPGDYQVTEASGDGSFTLAAVDCSDDDSAGNLETRTATFRAAPGETVTCTFTNQIVSGDPGDLTIVAYHDLDGSGNLTDGDGPLKGWTARVRNSGGDLMAPETKTGANGQATFAALPPGPYRACLVVPSGWANSDPGASRTTPEKEVCRASTVQPGQETEAFFGNWQADFGLFLPSVIR